MTIAVVNDIKSNTSTEPCTRGLHHLGLTVPDIAQTAAFFVGQLNFRVVGERPDYPAIFVSDGVTMLTLWQATDPATALAFDRHKHVGLHHFALKVETREALETLHKRLAALGDIDIEFAPEALGDLPAMHMMCRIPGGLRVEFFALMK